MRVLIATAPGYGHVFAPVPLAWALRAAGHDVVLATAGRPEAGIDVATWSGLAVAEVAAPVVIDAVRTRLRADRVATAERMGVGVPELVRRLREDARAAKDTPSGNPFAFAAEIYGPMSAAMAPGLVSFARRWGPDLVVHEAMQGAGPLAAAVLGVPVVEHLAGLCRGPELAAALGEHLAGEYERHGVARPRPDLVLEVAPPSVAVNEPYGRPMRFVPFAGGGVLPDEDMGATGLPRVAVTFGSLVPSRLGFGPVDRLRDALGAVDAEFVLALGPVDDGAAGPLPCNVRVCDDYVPLTALLPRCDAVVHHGGPATTLAALDAGLPQMVLPEMADQFVNGEAVRRRGAALVCEDGRVPARALGQLLADPSLRAAAADVRSEIALLPCPSDVVGELEGLAARGPHGGVARG